MKFVLFVEGQTEDKAISDFLQRWLNARLDRAVGIQTVRFKGWADLVTSLSIRIPMYLSNADSNKDVIAVLSLIDLYGPEFYPNDMITSDDRYTWAKKHLEDLAGSDRFRQFFAVHESEAWLLSNTKQFPSAIQKSLSNKAVNPEKVNSKEPPAKLLDRLYTRHLNRQYRKVADGGNLFRTLDPNIAYEKCPYLKLMLDEMLTLAQAAGV